MKMMSDDELIALGLNVQAYRQKGGHAVLQKYGRKHFSLLGKRSAQAKQAKKAMNNGVMLPQSTKIEAK